MRAVLHHPDFQAVESAWRSLELLARRAGGGGRVEIALHDLSAEEWAADLAAQEDLSQSGLFGMLAEAPRLDEGRGALSAVIGLYTLDETPAHAALLARMARIAAWIDAPFVAAIAPEVIDTPLRERAPEAARAWDALRALPAAGYVGLAVSSFVLRLPYGRRTEPVEPFDFEEFATREGMQGMLWANPALLSAILMAETAARTGPAKMRLGEIMTLDDMPLHHGVDDHGDPVALPCTERVLDTSAAAKVVERGLIPVLSLKGRNVVRQGSFQSLIGRDLAGPWASAPGDVVDAEPGGMAPPAARAPEDAPPAEADPETGADAAMSELDDLLAGLEEGAALEAEASGAEASGAEDDGLSELDGLLASLSVEEGAPEAASPATPEATDPDPEDDGLSELDDLLASLGEDDAAPEGEAEDDDEMDPDLAALLKDL